MINIDALVKVSISPFSLSVIPIGISRKRLDKRKVHREVKLKHNNAKPRLRSIGTAAGEEEFRETGVGNGKLFAMSKTRKIKRIHANPEIRLTSTVWKTLLLPGAAAESAP